MDEIGGAQPDEDVRVLIADDQPVVREGFSLLLDAVDGFHAVGCVSDCDELVNAVKEHEPDVVLLDMCLGGEEGLVVIQRVKARHPDVAVLLFPTDIAEASLKQALACGINGVMLKNAPVQEILESINKVAGGTFVLGRDLAAPSESSEPSQLSSREREVLRLLADGLSNREISQSLFISVATTKSHLENIARKLGTSHRAAAVAEAIRRGLVA